MLIAEQERLCFRDPRHPAIGEYLIPRYAKYLTHQRTRARQFFQQPSVIMESGWTLQARQVHEVWPLSIQLEPGMTIRLIRDRPDIGLATHGRFSLIAVTW